MATHAHTKAHTKWDNIVKLPLAINNICALPITEDIIHVLSQKSLNT